MDIRPMRTEADHAEALCEMERLWDAPEGSNAADKLDVLATLVDAYESARWPVKDSDPIDILRYAIDEMGHSQSELAQIVGSRPRASELFNRRRALTIEMIDKISKAWGVPTGILAVPYPIRRSRAA